MQVERDGVSAVYIRIKIDGEQEDEETLASLEGDNFSNFCDHMNKLWNEIKLPAAPPRLVRE